MKIMVVEDDAALREIYSIRITAEGYEVVSAGDGEEALAVAVREKPDLILSDVMMPKISGFDMLDILRSTPETANIKVIMMTALSADDQRARGERLGADRYLVKSQVGIEDVVNAIHEVLGDKPATAPAEPAAPSAEPAAPAAPAEPAEPTIPSAPVAPASAVPEPVVEAPVPVTPQPPVEQADYGQQPPAYPAQ
ncbi:response regulator [Candidatus Saccharibacteria bacterium]|nr:response regulator [Candidatus Saccharibacteria bacterium]